MSRLFLAELRRIRARRLVRLTVSLAAAGIALGAILAFTTSSSLSERAYQQRVRAADTRRQQEQAQVEACVRSHKIDPGKFDRIPDDVARACFPDKGVSGAHDPRFHRKRLQGVLQGVSGVLAIVAWALGASLVGSEFASRSMTTLLTFETRRERVLLAKMSAVLLAAALFAFAVLAVVTLTMLPALVAHGAPLRAEDPSWATLAGIIGRGTALAALAGGIGFAIATIGRNTAAALGAGFAYIVVLENILGSSIARWRRWLMLGNIIVFVSGRSNGGDVPGRTVTEAGLFLAAVTLALLVGALSAFRVRDIA